MNTIPPFRGAVFLAINFHICQTMQEDYPARLHHKQALPLPAHTLMACAHILVFLLILAQ